MSQLFVFIYHRLRSRRMRGFFFLVLIVAAFIYLGSKIQLNQDYTQVLPQNENTQVLHDLFTNSEFLNRMVFHVHLRDSAQQPDPDRLAGAASQILDSLKGKFHPGLIQKIEGKFSSDVVMNSYDYFYKNLPLYMDQKDYARMDSLIDHPGGMRQVMYSNYKTLISPSGLVTNQYILKDPLHLVSSKLKRIRNLQFDTTLTLYNNYLFTRDHKNLLFFILPAEKNNTVANEKLIEGIDRIIRRVEQHYKDSLEVEYFGAAPMAVANANQIKEDIRLTVSIAFVLLIILFSYYFRKLRYFLLIFFPVILGWLGALAIFYILQGGISAIALGVGSVLLGISVDYSLHVLTHHKKKQGVVHTLQANSNPLLISSITTATAFFCLIYISSEALTDLGRFAGISMLFAVLFSLIMIPQFVSNKDYAPTPAKSKNTLIDRISGFRYHENKYAIGLVLIVSLFFIAFHNKAQFETDIEKSNYSPPHLQQARKQINQISNVTRQSIYVLASGDNLDQALSRNEKIYSRLAEFNQTNQIGGFSGINELILSRQKQKQKIQEWENFWDAQKRKKLKERLISAGKQYHFKASAFDEFFKAIEKDYTPGFASELHPPYQGLLENFIIKKQDQVRVVNLVKITSQDQKQLLYRAFEDQDQILVANKKSFVEDLFAALKKDFNRLITISLSLVLVILIFSFGHVGVGLVTFLPMVLSWTWITGIMSVFGLKFNLFNIVISTFIFGLGIDYSIFVTMGILHKLKWNQDYLSSYKSSILLSSFTTIIGIGVLIFAQHPALESIAALSIIGIISVLFIAFTLQPVLLHWMLYKNHRKRIIPIKIHNIIFSLVGYSVYMVGGIVLALLIPVFRILPVSRKRKQLWFRKLIQLIGKATLLALVQNPYKIYHKDKLDFNRPSIVIANHQSMVDLIILMALSNKLIILAKPWVWRIPLLSSVIGYAGHIRISEENYHDAFSSIQNKMQEGLSILVFPEGKRSHDNKIHRFHKGAFYLAEQMDAEIQPLLIHGAHRVLSKKEYIAREGAVSLHVLERIRQRQHFGKDYSEQSKAICKFMREQYQRISARMETPRYLRGVVLSNYFCRGPVLEGYIRVKMSLEQDYALYDKLIPSNASVLDLGCGYGMLAYMLSLTGGERKITALDYDEKKIQIAKHGALNNDRIAFYTGHIMNFHFPLADAIIMNDVLHYLPGNQQVEVLKRCAKSISEKGMILIRDGNKENKNKHVGTRLTEFFSTNLGFNKTENKLSFFSRSDIQDFANANGLHLQIFSPRKATSNILYVLTNRNQ